VFKKCDKAYVKHIQVTLRLNIIKPCSNHDRGKSGYQEYVIE